jgi:hypothetical protein
MLLQEFNVIFSGIAHQFSTSFLHPKCTRHTAMVLLLEKSGVGSLVIEFKEHNHLASVAD